MEGISAILQKKKEKHLGALFSSNKTFRSC
jgi:hypothetical protein